MNIVILTGSPHRGGTSDYLAERFEEGAKRVGNRVVRFDTAFMNVGFCRGCNRCEGGLKDCVLKDDFELMKPELLDADVIVFAMPLIYYGVPGQLKCAIDRFYGIDFGLRKKQKSVVLLLTCGEIHEERCISVTSEYQLMNEYFGWYDLGKVIALGSMNRELIEKTQYGDEAYELGRKMVRE